MKKKFIVVAAITVCFVNLTFAGGGLFYTEPGTFMAKFSGACPSGNVVQSILQSGSAAVAPTNVSPYLGPGEIISTSPQKCSVMGTDKVYEYYFVDGKLASLHSGSDTYLHGYVRAFSGSTIPGSAYYGNSPCEAINPNTGAGSDNPIISNVYVNIPNPAYIIPWSQVPTTNAIGTAIIGTVDTADNDNNKLTPADVKIQVREKPTGDWEDHALPYTPGVAGDFQVRAIYVGGSFPVSTTYDVNGVVPEPALAILMAILFSMLAFRRPLKK